MKNTPEIDPLPEPDGEPVKAVDDPTDEGAIPQDIQEKHTGPSTPHDPALHESPPRVVIRDGAPTWAKRRGGAPKNKRAPGSISSRVEAPEKTTNSTQEQTASVDANASAQAVGFMAASAFVSLCGLIGGEEFTPEPGEQEALNNAAAAYCAAKGYVDLPPGVALACVATVFVAKRWNAPKFSEKRAKWMKSFKKKESEPTP